MFSRRFALKMKTMVFAIFSLMLSASAADVNDADAKLLKEVAVSCVSSDVDGDRVAELQGMASKTSGKSLTVTFSPAAMKALVSGARKLKELGWVVTDGKFGDSALRNKTLTRQQYETLTAKPAICMIMEEVPTCTETSRKFAAALLSEPQDACVKFAPPKDIGNGMRAVHRSLIETLWKNGFQYDAKTGEWTKTPEAAPPPSPGDGQH